MILHHASIYEIGPYGVRAMKMLRMKVAVNLHELHCEINSD